MGKAHWMTERTNEVWIASLSADGSAEQDEALRDLQTRLRRGILFYLTRERSDLTDRAMSELEHMADDFSQEAVLRILKNLHSFRGDSLFTTWATRVAVRVAISELRRARYKDFSLEAVTAEGDLMLDTGNSSQTNMPVNPEKAAERSDVAMKLQGVIADALTERQRTALTAVGFNGIPLEIVAAEMNTNRNALYKLLHDARSKLKAGLEAQGLTMDYIRDLFEA
jgi:RNA polymerase sigma-70 factor (ECF subfamily)